MKGIHLILTALSILSLDKVCPISLELNDDMTYALQFKGKDEESFISIKFLMSLI